MAWFDKGLVFSCEGCGHCCSGEPGFVFLSAEEIEAISNFLSLSQDDFLSLYTRWIDRGDYYNLSLKEHANYDCVFLKDKRCEIYPVRPNQCRTYPFWPYLMEERALWEAEKEACPGIGHGEHHDAAEIREKLKERKKYRECKLKK